MISKPITSTLPPPVPSQQVKKSKIPKSTSSIAHFNEMFSSSSHSHNQIKKSSSASSNLILKNNISDDSTNLAGPFLEQIKMGLNKTVTIDKSKPFIK